METGRKRFAIDLAPPASWATVEQIRREVADAVLEGTGDREASGTVALVVAELAENAVKYGRFDASAPTYRVRASGDDRRATVSVESPVGPDAPPALLFETLAWLRSFESPGAAYQARIQKLAGERSPRPEGAPNRLGLARLACEAGCTLDAEIVGTTLRVSAEIQLEPEGRR